MTWWGDDRRKARLPYERFEDPFQTGPAPGIPLPYDPGTGPTHGGAGDGGTGTGGTGGTGGGGDDPYAPPVFDYTSPIYGGPYKPIYDFPDVPEFDFLAPSEEDALNEPGYRFRLDESLKALQRSAAARGVLRGGGTLSGITERAQNMASAEYGNVWNRAWQEQSSEFAPQMAEWAKLMDAEQNAGDAEWQRYWDAHVYSIDDVYRRERDLLQAGL